MNGQNSVYHRSFTAKVSAVVTPLSASSTQHTWELLAGNCMAVLLWHAQGQQISIYADLCASKSNKTNCKQGAHTHQGSNSCPWSPLPGDMAVCMHEVLARSWVGVFWVGLLYLEILALSSYSKSEFK